MSGIYRVEHAYHYVDDDPDAWQATWRQTDRSHVTVLVAHGPLNIVLAAIEADAHLRSHQ